MSATGNFVRIFLHFNWSTKRRLPSIDNEAANIVRRVAHAKAHELGFFVLGINGIEDHVHLLVSVPATLSASEIAKHIKGASAFAINQVRPSGFAHFQWQRGFAVLSVSPEAVNRIRAYIDRQQEHHTQNSLIEELEVEGEESDDA